MVGASSQRSSSVSESPMPAPRFYSVGQAANMFGISPMTLYRAISDGQFPAVRIRGRLIVPAQAVEAMTDAAIADQGVVDASAWVRGEVAE
jgi:excisionase family DNA binding protein